MTSPRSVVTLLVGVGCLISVARTVSAVELTTGLLRSNGDNDHIDCCLANVDNVPTTLFDLVVYNDKGTVASLNYLGYLPTTIAGQQGSCAELIVNPGFYRCAFVLPDTTAERVRGTLAILDDHHGILGELEAHPVPALPPCAEAAAPQCNGTCPPNSGYCMAYDGGCYCNIR